MTGSDNPRQTTEYKEQNVLCQIIFKKRQWKSLWKSSGRYDMENTRSRRIPHALPMHFHQRASCPNLRSTELLDYTRSAIGVRSVTGAIGNNAAGETRFDFHKILITMDLKSFVFTPFRKCSF